VTQMSPWRNVRDRFNASRRKVCGLCQACLAGPRILRSQNARHRFMVCRLTANFRATARTFSPSASRSKNPLSNNRFSLVTDPPKCENAFDTQSLQADGNRDGRGASGHRVPQRGQTLSNAEPKIVTQMGDAIRVSTGMRLYLTGWLSPARPGGWSRFCQGPGVLAHLQGVTDTLRVLAMCQQPCHARRPVRETNPTFAVQENHSERPAVELVLLSLLKGRQLAELW
jgi:hypothetical protein